jgi:OOP family OmpA-OmpF porin
VRAVDFEYNSDRLTAPARQTLDDVARALVAQPELRVEIQGYTDSIGSAAYNLRLSQRRADMVRSYLGTHGVDISTLTARGFGKDDPIANNATAEGRAQNRRVAFRVTNVPAHIHVETEGATDAGVEAAEKGAQPTRQQLNH